MSLYLKFASAIAFFSRVLFGCFMGKLTITDLKLNGKKVLLRVDFNVPLDSEGMIADDSRIKAALPTIKYILDHGASVIVMSHLGRPKGVDSLLSLKVCAERLAKLLHIPVLMAPDCVGAEVETMVHKMPQGSVLMLENLRFHKGEEQPEDEVEFVQNLARLGDVYVNDAFGTAHRAHASTAMIAKYFPGKAAAGFLMQDELNHLIPLLHEPKRPFYAIIGGAKISTKAGVIHNLLDRVDGLFLGGAMAYTFLQAKGIKVGASLVDEREINAAKEILQHPNVYLPLDFIVADAFSESANIKHVLASEGFDSPWQGMDIGSKTIQDWKQKLQGAETVFWNGPLGVYEMDKFFVGTKEIALFLATLKKTVVVGGGDSIAAIEKLQITDQFTHLSTGGGASLELLEYGHLPGIDALSKKL